MEINDCVKPATLPMIALGIFLGAREALPATPEK
jgi:hypothetical protein